MTLYEIYFHGRVEPVTLRPEEALPLIAHPQAFRFICSIELCGELSPVSETEAKE